MSKATRLRSRLQWISIGAGRSFRAVIRWVESGKTKEIQKKRVFIVGGAALGALALSVEFPTVVPGVLLVLTLGVVAWWGMLPHEEMTMKFSDFQAPVSIDGSTFLGGEVLKKYADAFPGESAAQLAARLSQVPGGDAIDEQAVLRAYAEAGIRLPEQRVEKTEVTPVEEEVTAKSDAPSEKTPAKAAGKFLKDRLEARRKEKSADVPAPEHQTPGERPEGSAVPQSA